MTYKKASYSRKGSINNNNSKLKNVWKDLGTFNTLMVKEVISGGKYERSPKEVDMVARNQKLKKTK